MSAQDDYYIDLKPGKKCIAIRTRHILIWSGRESDGSYIQGRPTNENENVLIDIIVKHRAEIAQLRASAKEAQEAHVYLDESPVNGDPDETPVILADRIALLVGDVIKLRERITSLDDDKYCPLCTWRGPVELVNGICPQCDVDWPKAYREYRDALTIAKARIAEQARQLAEARRLIEYIMPSVEPYMVTQLRAWLAANPAQEVEQA